MLIGTQARSGTFRVAPGVMAVLLACRPAGSEVPTSSAAVPTAGIEGATAVTGPAVLDGVILGPDGEPLNSAEIQIRRYGNSQATRVERTDEAGYFHAQLPGPGIYFMEFSSPEGASVSQVVYVAGHTRVAGSLGAGTALTWRGHDRDLAHALDRARDWNAEKGEIFEAGAEAEGPDRQPQEEMTAALRRLAENTLAEADGANSLPRAALIRMARVAELGLDMSPTELDTSLEWLLENVPADDPRWPAFVSFPSVLRHALNEPTPPPQLHEYLDEMVTNHRDPGWAATVAEVRLHYFDETGEKARFERLYAQMMSPRFKDTDARTRAKDRYETAFEVGHPLPEFDFVSLDNPPQRIRSGDRDGRSYLLVFWAPWSVESVEMMDEFRRAYAAVNGVEVGEPAKKPRLEFVFISFEADRARVQQFRKSAQPMPWTHGFAPLGDQGLVHAQFGFTSLPIPVLVGADGVVLEAGDALLGPRLSATLQRLGP